ncbi:hypothetical protein FOMG_04542 [Fusarium oxysporum f. sp. melonis 26406]|uniref:Uncharacterized protein n=1 Tax=Fusarium oxysporum f. sp. melonis 26406 TaxID=1089452 RepID=X0AA17_FUSOX|nr:hypothetical protein FOMG_04542 [Fusarium oxysporum f. sp. melonis 26406]
MTETWPKLSVLGSWFLVPASNLSAFVVKGPILKLKAPPQLSGFCVCVSIGEESA